MLSCDVLFGVFQTDTKEWKIWFISRVFIIARKLWAEVLHHFLQRFKFRFPAEMEKKTGALKGMWQLRPSQGARAPCVGYFSPVELSSSALAVSWGGRRRWERNVFPFSVPLVYFWVAWGEWRTGEQHGVSWVLAMLLNFQHYSLGFVLFSFCSVDFCLFPENTSFLFLKVCGELAVWEPGAWETLGSDLCCGNHTAWKTGEMTEEKWQDREDLCQVSHAGKQRLRSCARADKT